MQARKHVVVLGGGVGGLVTAWMLRHVSLKRLASQRRSGLAIADAQPLKITILESGNRFGGWLQTTRIGPRQLLFELGCRGIRPVGQSGKDALHLVELLGLQHATLAASKSSSMRFIQVGDSILPVPVSLRDVISSPLTNNLPTWILKDFATKSRIKSSEFDDESLADFATRRFGDRENLANTLLDAAMSGIYAGDVSKLSAASVAKVLWDFEGKGIWPFSGSVIGGMLSNRLSTLSSSTSSSTEPSRESSFFIEKASQASSVSFIDGMQMLSDELEAQLRNDDNVSLSSLTDVVKIEPSSDGNGVGVFCKPASASSSGQEIRADAVISALPASSLANVLPSSVSTAISRLKQIEFANVAVVGLGWRRRGIIPQDLSGFGFLTPTKERSKRHNILGAVFDSNAFPGQTESFAAGRRLWRAKPGSSVSPCTESVSPNVNTINESRISVMLGGSHWPQVIDEGKSSIEDLAIKAVQSLLGVSVRPSDVVVNVGKACIPQYNVGHKERVNDIQLDIEKKFNGNVSIIGNSFNGVGVADTISHAMRVGDKVSSKLFP
jgi:protoporphyrinogen/coproporphyrinogen III oxidase